MTLKHWQGKPTLTGKNHKRAKPKVLAQYPENKKANMKVQMQRIDHERR